ncbi:SRPBCC domain-containing protein [Ilumatobacter coccineus]|uniref:VOC domain-containing protein n=1 Tax=Ilumatobacter coccineus (strain NBRC 103263 / KCTC 29153 / YM16-304) TaxID=1313172 RepID=A0A6C7E4P0_ILUCY|nr:SRPBCC domain-containing protein [Ilumatobacter coccineus]BAN01503.1 hypothetical protein YM304_11890 [Ilumatobacter coccineus YM16-304]
MISLTLAQAAVTDLPTAEAWYARLLAAAPSTRPMDGLIEWRFGPTHGLQVFHDSDRAGTSTVILGLTDLDNEVERLDREAIEHSGIQDGGGGRLAIATDPDGNQVILLDPDAARNPVGDGSVVGATFHIERVLDASLERVWDAYADVAQRSVWSVPKGEVVEYGANDFVAGGIDEYRCGPPDDLANRVTTRYRAIHAPHSFVTTNEIDRDDTPVAVDTTCWRLETDGLTTTVSIDVQVTSLVGAAMLDGYRNGHERTLDHLQEFLA